MRIDELTEKEKMQIIEECTNTKELYKTIAKKYNLNIEDFYEVINEYCRKNNYVRFLRGKRAFEKIDGTVVRKNKGEESIIEVKNKRIEDRRERLLQDSIKSVKEIEEWFDSKGRLPRKQIHRSKSCKRR